MKILGIDPSLSCTGLCFIHTDGYLSEYSPSYFESDKTLDINSRVDDIIHHINNWLAYCMESHKYDWTLDAVFIEGEAMQASGQVVQLAELSGAIKYFFTTRGIKVFTYTPSQARKMVLGVGKIPFDKTKQKKEYIDFIRDKIRSDEYPYDFGYEIADQYDALVVAKAGEIEMLFGPSPAFVDQNLMAMRLHDHKVLTKNNKGVYTFGTGKKKVQFKKLSKADSKTYSSLLERYREIIAIRSGT